MEKLKEVLAFVNNKGGVGKTTTVQNVAAGLLRKNKNFRILCIDLDPQGNLSALLGWKSIEKKFINKITVSDALRDGDNNHLPVYKCKDGLYLVPSCTTLADIEADLHRQMSSKMVLSSLFGNEIEYMDGKYQNEKEKFTYLQDDFDYILIDCAPALSELTYNALGAATGVIIPVQLGSLSVEGIGRMIEAYRNVHRKLNKELDLRGLLIVMADERTKMARETIEYLDKTYSDITFKTKIRQCVRVGESQFIPTDIFDYEPNCTAGIDYAAFVDELLKTASNN